MTDTSGDTFPQRLPERLSTGCECCNRRQMVSLVRVLHTQKKADEQNGEERHIDVRFTCAALLRNPVLARRVWETALLSIRTTHRYPGQFWVGTWNTRMLRSIPRTQA